MVDGVFLWDGQDPAVTQDKYETRDTEDKIKGVVPIPPSNHILKFKYQER